MKAVILAAGKGTRMGDLAAETPKPMLKVLGKTLLEHKLDSLPDSINEAVITVGYLKDKIISIIGEKYGRLKITYVEQKELLGTAHSLWSCKELLKDEKKFLVMMGDDIYSGEDMADCLARPWSILILATRSVKGKAKTVIDHNGMIQDIIERYAGEEPGFICAGMYSLTPEIFKYEMLKWDSAEYGLPQTILGAKNDRDIHAVQARFWLQITAPEDLRMAEQFFELEAHNKK